MERVGLVLFRDFIVTGLHNSIDLMLFSYII